MVHLLTFTYGHLLWPWKIHQQGQENTKIKNMKTKLKVKVDSITSISITTVNPLFTSMDILGWTRPSARKWDKFFAFRLSKVTTLVASLWQMFTPSTKRDRNSISILDIFLQNMQKYYQTFRNVKKVERKKVTTNLSKNFHPSLG